MIPHKESKQTEKLEDVLPVHPRINPSQGTCHVPGMFEASGKQNDTKSRSHGAYIVTGVTEISNR